jgi:hypothetical protein
MKIRNEVRRESAREEERRCVSSCELRRVNVKSILTKLVFVKLVVFGVTMRFINQYSYIYILL